MNPLLEGVLIGTGGGLLADEVGEHIQKEIKQQKTSEDLLEELKLELQLAIQWYKGTIQNKKELHILTILWLDHPTTIRYEGYYAVFILVSVASTFTVTPPGLIPFTWTPTVGVYNRFRYSEGTTIQLKTGGALNLTTDILYTNDITE